MSVLYQSQCFIDIIIFLYSFVSIANIWIFIYLVSIEYCNNVCEVSFCYVVQHCKIKEIQIQSEKTLTNVLVL